MTGRLDAIREHLLPTDDEHRVTTLELFFDLVFVFAITNITGLMEHDLGATTVLEGVITLALVWFGWCSYAWLGNQAKADEGLLRLALIVAMAGMFFVAISIPHSFSPEGNAAGVLVAAYAIVRLTHIGVYLLAVGDDQQLRSVLRGMFGVTMAMLVPLIVGAVVGGAAHKWWWLAAVAVDQLGVYFVRSTRWRLSSASHFAERFGLIVIIAIGESVVAIGTASSAAMITVRTAVALGSGLVVTVALWWLYFDVVALVAARVLQRAQGVERTRLARDSYTYIHFPIVAGIVFVALGLVVLIHDEDHLAAGRYALFGGVVVHLVGHALFRWRNVGSVNTARMAVAGAFLALTPLLRGADALVVLLAAAAILGGLVAWEVRSSRDARAEIRRAAVG